MEVQEEGMPVEEEFVFILFYYLWACGCEVVQDLVIGPYPSHDATHVLSLFSKTA